MAQFRRDGITATTVVEPQAGGERIDDDDNGFGAAECHGEQLFSRLRNIAVIAP